MDLMHLSIDDIDKLKKIIKKEDQMKDRIIKMLGGTTSAEVSRLYEMNIKLEDALHEERKAHNRIRNFFGKRKTSAQEKTDYFMVGHVACDFKTIFLDLVSSRARENDWSFTSEVFTNDLQDEVYFSQNITHGKTSNFKTVYTDVEAVILYMREIGFMFNVRTIKRAALIEFTNIRQKGSQEKWKIEL